MTDIQAALGLSQLKRLDQIVEKRNKILNLYKDLATDLPINFLTIPPNTYSSVHLAIVYLKFPDEALHQKLFNFLRINNIGVQVHYIPIHLHPFYKNLGFKKGDFPNSERYAVNAISLPIFPNISEEIPVKVVNLIRKIII